MGFIDEGEDIGDGLVEFERDGFADFADFEEESGDGAIFDHRDFVFGGEGFDSAGESVFAFGQDHGGFIATAFVFEGDGVVGGVGDDDIGGGDGAEHLFLHQATSHLPHGHFGFGVTLGLALFFGDLVAGHHEVVLSFAELVGVVDGGDGTEGEDDAAEEGGGGGEDENAEMVGLDGGVEDGVVGDAFDAAPSGVADDEEFEEIGGEFDRALGGENALEAFGGIEAGEFEAEGFGGELEAALEATREEAGPGAGEGHGEDEGEHRGGGDLGPIADGLGFDRVIVEVTEDADADAGNFFRVLAGTELEDAESGEEDEDDLEIWGPSELAFCGGFAKAFFGRLFGFYSLIGHNLAITG